MFSQNQGCQQVPKKKKEFGSQNFSVSIIFFVLPTHFYDQHFEFRFWWCRFGFDWGSILGSGFQDLNLRKWWLGNYMKPGVQFFCPSQCFWFSFDILGFEPDFHNVLAFFPYNFLQFWLTEFVSHYQSFNPFYELHLWLFIFTLIFFPSSKFSWTRRFTFHLCLK